MTPAPLAVHSIDEFAISVPDLAVARHFYLSFGLDVREEGGRLGLYTHGHPHRWGRVLGGQPRKKLLWLGFGTHAGDLARFAQAFGAAGIAPLAPPPGADPGGLWIASPDGVAVRVREAPKCSPSRPAPREALPPAAAGAGRAPSSRDAGTVRPLYLSHLLLFTPDVQAALAFCCERLGLRLSDRCGSIIVFLHTPHGSDHHLIAFAKSHAPGLHHSSWCVPSIDAVGHGMSQMAGAGYAEGWGVGRHVLGSNHFRYVRDPWGSYAEYSFDIDFVPEGTTWPRSTIRRTTRWTSGGPRCPTTSWSTTKRTGTGCRRERLRRCARVCRDRAGRARDATMAIGAADIVNPAAQEGAASPIAGMPVFEVWKARTSIALIQRASPPWRSAAPTSVARCAQSRPAPTEGRRRAHGPAPAAAGALRDARGCGSVRH